MIWIGITVLCLLFAAYEKGRYDGIRQAARVIFEESRAGARDRRADDEDGGWQV
jgi:hypothetical protein